MSNEHNKEQSIEKKANHRSRLIIYLVAVLVAVLTGMSAYQLFIEWKAQHQQRNNLIETVNTLKNEVSAMKLSSEKSESLQAEQEKLVAEWKQFATGDMEKWRVAEGFYLVKLANDALQFSHNTVLALALLQRADAVLKEDAHEGFLDIRKSIAGDIAKIESTPKVNVTDIYLQLTSLDSAFDQLPLPYSPLKQISVITPRNYDNMPWWKSTWLKTWDSLRKVIIVRNTTQSTLPLVLPDEKPFLYQNVHAQMETIIWALLARNEVIYQNGLTRLVNWIDTYFDKDASETKTILEHLNELKGVNIEPSEMNLSETVELFDRYITSKEQASSI